MKSSSSWGCELKWYRELAVYDTTRSSSSWGCELKCFHNHTHSKHTSSSSSWGCELKYLLFCVHTFTVYRHPLREDVSWNVISTSAPTLNIVILFVRMWVEIRLRKHDGAAALVILFVRMWVEIKGKTAYARGASHPLREDVSWNNWYFCSTR